MNLLEEFTNEYTKNQNKKISKSDIKNICNSFVEYINLKIESIVKDVKENKKKREDINIITLKGLGKISVSPREGREITLSDKKIVIHAHWALKFKPVLAIKKKLKEI
jgi:nucleoid DNA-binding protein